MGIVYRARDVRLDQPRAIKFIRTGPFADAEAYDRFNREAKAVARLDHPGVVRIFTLGEHGDTLYICMEYLEGGNLHARLRQGPMEIRMAADMVCRLALAMQHAHENSVLHRDLKPANVLLTADGTPKVSDFGLAKLLDEQEELTQAGAVMGTASYMAPEQAESRHGDVRAPADIWALGVILYQCLTGKLPFRGAGRSETLEAVKNRLPAPPRQLRPDVPAALQAICLKCLREAARTSLCHRGAVGGRSARLARRQTGERLQRPQSAARLGCCMWSAIPVCAAHWRNHAAVSRPNRRERRTAADRSGAAARSLDPLVDAGARSAPLAQPGKEQQPAIPAGKAGVGGVVRRPRLAVPGPNEGPTLSNRGQHGAAPVEWQRRPVFRLSSLLGREQARTSLRVARNPSRNHERPSPAFPRPLAHGVPSDRIESAHPKFSIARRRTRPFLTCNRSRTPLDSMLALTELRPWR